eukprot:TRINITY_DN2757_c0_g1_i1.p1 TRINITY_DN2757_c0_g1~~TRINITY_DN2757_c0_g1_i1.p1  ORF type:complete len:131 (-),score=52.04 TRINITY_DN2757_c0_g1_i1:92-451(-)
MSSQEGFSGGGSSSKPKPTIQRNEYEAKQLFIVKARKLQSSKQTESTLSPFRELAESSKESSASKLELKTKRMQQVKELLSSHNKKTGEITKQGYDSMEKNVKAIVSEVDQKKAQYVFQ